MPNAGSSRNPPHVPPAWLVSPLSPPGLWGGRAPGLSCSCWNFPSLGFGSCTEKRGDGSWAGPGRRHPGVQKMKASERAEAPGLPLSCFLFCSSGFSPGPAQGSQGLLGWDTHPQGHPWTGAPTRRDITAGNATSTGTPLVQGHRQYRDTTGTGAPPVWGHLRGHRDGSLGAAACPAGGEGGQLCGTPRDWGVPLWGAALGLAGGPIPVLQAGLSRGRAAVRSRPRLFPSSSSGPGACTGKERGRRALVPLLPASREQQQRGAGCQDPARPCLHRQPWDRPLQVMLSPSRP